MAMSQLHVVRALKSLGGYRTASEIRDRIRKNDPSNSIVTERTAVYSHLSRLQRKWGLVSSRFDLRKRRKVYRLTKAAY